MPNKQRGYVTIAAGGKPRPLRFSLNALAELEDKLGVKNMTELLSVDFNSFRTLRTFVVVGLMDGDRDLDEQAALSMFREVEDNVEDISRAILDALTASGVVKEADESEVPPPKGTSSPGRKRSS
jgi:hypothetical protein